MLSLNADVLFLAPARILQKEIACCWLTYVRVTSTKQCQTGSRGVPEGSISAVLYKFLSSSGLGSCTVIHRYNALFRRHKGGGGRPQHSSRGQKRGERGGRGGRVGNNGRWGRWSRERPSSCQRNTVIVGRISYPFFNGSQD
jgi:hypothetical protein